jgi:hypothetical protein
VWLDGLTEGEPAYAIGERYFGLGTSPGALKAFLDTSAARRGWRGGEWMPDDAAASRNVMAHVAAKRLRSWLTENKASLAEAVARWQKVDAKGVVKRLDRLSEGLELADDLVLGAKFEEGELVISGGPEPIGCALCESDVCESVPIDCPFLRAHGERDRRAPSEYALLSGCSRWCDRAKVGRMVVRRG